MQKLTEMQELGQDFAKNCDWMLMEKKTFENLPETVQIDLLPCVGGE